MPLPASERRRRDLAPNQLTSGDHLAGIAGPVPCRGANPDGVNDTGPVPTVVSLDLPPVGAGVLSRGDLDLFRVGHCVGLVCGPDAFRDPWGVFVAVALITGGAKPLAICRAVTLGGYACLHGLARGRRGDRCCHRGRAF